MEMSDIQKVLEECEFFKGLDRQQVESIAPICRVCRYEAGESVYQQGGLGEDLYIVAEGQVAMERLCFLLRERLQLVLGAIETL
jgi:CRP-like cAMP-binding protein